jgi:hypothetical protein
MDDVEICIYDLPVQGNGQQGKIAILRGGLGADNPVAYMDEAVSRFVERNLHNQFIEVFLDNPYVRVIVSNINELDYNPFIDQRLG